MPTSSRASGAWSRSAAPREDLAGWDKGTTLTVNSPKTIAWAEENKASVAEKRALKPQTIADANTLRTEDGR